MSIGFGDLFLPRSMKNTSASLDDARRLRDVSDVNLVMDLLTATQSAGWLMKKNLPQVLGRPAAGALIAVFVVLTALLYQRKELAAPGQPGCCGGGTDLCARKHPRGTTRRRPA